MPPIRAVLAAAAAGAVLRPDLLGLDHRFPAAPAAAWRPHAAVAGLLVAAGLAARPRTRSVGLGVGAVAAGALASAAPRLRGRPGAPGPDDLTVLAVNVLAGRADTGALAAVVAREEPDVVVLPEAGHDHLGKLLPLVAHLGYFGTSSTPPGVPDIRGVAVLARGDVRTTAGEAMRLGHVEVRGGRLGDRVLHAVHTTAPMRPRMTAQWRHDLAVAAEWGRAGGIVVGDLNATLDHRLLRAVGTSAAAGAGRALVGTWPSALPRWAGIQIDHVLVPPGTVTTRYEVLDVPGTDHRGVLARLRLP